MARTMPFLEALPGEAAWVDARGVIEAANAAWRGLDEGQALVGAGFPVGGAYADALEARGGDDAAALAAAVRGALGGAPAGAAQVYACDVGGAERWYEVTVGAGPAEAGGGALVLHRDVTAWRRDREELRERARAYTTLLSNVSGMAYRCRNDDSWTMELVSDGCLEITGYPASALLMNREVSFNDLVHPDDQQPLWDRCQVNLERRRPCSNEYRIIHRSGEIRWVWDQAQGVYGPGGELLAIEGLVTDVTEARAAQERHRRSEARYRSLVDHAADVIFTLGPDGGITSLNPAFEAVTGERREAWLGRPFALLVDRGQSEATEEALRDVIESASRRTLRVRLRARSGPWRECEITLAPHAPAGEDAGVLGVARDITERALLERQLAEAQKMEAIGRLAGGIAHDFNNLLTGIRGYASLLSADLPPGSQHREDAEEIGRSASRASQLTSQILAFARRQHVEPRLVDLNQLVDDAARVLRRTLGEDLELLTVLDPGLPPVRIDPVQLEQVLFNLAINARDAMPQGGRLTLETARVFLDEDAAAQHRVDLRGPYAMLSVGDSGVGIPPHLLTRIFEPFFTTKEQGRGTGLGLATAYGIVKQAGGGIIADSAPGRGATFRIYLPPVEGAPSPRTRPVPGVSGLTGTGTILVAEDEAIVRTLVARALRALGYTLLLASDGEAALTIATEYPEPIDLLLTDVVMPRMGGRALAERLRALRPGLRVLFMSGYAEVLHTEADGLDGEDFLAKPFTAGMLARCVRDALEREA